MIGYQGFAENILQESLYNPLIEQGFQQKDSVFLEVFRCVDILLILGSSSLLVKLG